MSMSTHVVGFRPPDDKWKKMKEAYDACHKAGVMVPPEVDDFFEGEEPSNNDMQVDISKAVKPFRADMQEGYEVDITKLPKDVKVVRFFNSY